MVGVAKKIPALPLQYHDTPSFCCCVFHACSLPSPLPDGEERGVLSATSCGASWEVPRAWQGKGSRGFWAGGAWCRCLWKTHLTTTPPTLRIARAAGGHALTALHQPLPAHARVHLQSGLSQVESPREARPCSSCQGLIPVGVRGGVCSVSCFLSFGPFR